MQAITTQNMLLRERVELPASLRIATDAFREGWNFAPADNARQLEKKICAREWNFIKIAEGVQASGVGETSQDAISSALRLALLRMSAYFNAVEVVYIELSQYPWFFLARLRVCQYRIQQGAVLAVSDEFAPSSITPRKRRYSLDANALYPDFGSSMPMIKQMLTARNTD
ncbi:MAG: hypothetical protein WAN35_15820 [Terracidiphilus sp.]